ncbi:hypothetical protein HB780_14675 [Rhizobium lusitanum]|uniref:hypothetical protein n=1 Tax=Rhizobium lusitanum TaxID=293958 RepID=UPI00160F46C8|nr:hypothetical protein [Rhizobium lusitanum]QND46979.1 hypothetical protein HB780_14675 [Rhizobium lusitanum]
MSGAAQAFGASAYNPKLFWGSFAVIIIGATMRLLPDGSKCLGYGPKTRLGAIRTLTLPFEATRVTAPDDPNTR